MTTKEDAMQDTEAIAAARRAYMKAGELFERRIGERETAKRALEAAQANMDHADDCWNVAAAAVDNAFEALRMLVAEAREASQS